MQHETGDTTAFRRELQPPAGGRRQRLNLADHGGQSAAAQPLLHRPKNVALIRRAQQHQPPGIEPGQCQTGCVEVGALQAPQHRPRGRQPRQDAGEKRHDRAILVDGTGILDLMQGSQRQTLPGQGLIDLRYPKGQHGDILAEALRLSQVTAQIGQPCLAGDFGSLSHVLYLFKFILRVKTAAADSRCPAPTLPLDTKARFCFPMLSP
jgi:hypothetical protein